MRLTSRFQKLRWDSADPDRAPPPLPIPPGSPSLQTRANASANIQAAAQKLSERATSAYTTNPMPPTSPDKSLIKGAAHRRMQSLQQGSVSDLRSYLDGMRKTSPERPTSSRAHESPISPDRDSTDYFSSPERGANTPTPAGRDALKEAPDVRPSTRSQNRSILGENTPPSATMLALQNMTIRDSAPPLGDITNASFRNLPQPSQNWESLASQITNLTNISLALQKEMTQLNRRSKDNATDLVSLKDAATTRDEDIRKSLKELVANIGSDAGSVFGRSSGYGLGLLGDKSFTSPTSAGKAFGPLPRSSSHNSLFEPGSPNPFSVEGAASVAMLEKIIREMVTKDGQERLLTTLNDILDKHSKDNSSTIETARKVEELADFIKQRPESQALIRTSPDPDAGDHTSSKVLEAMSADIIRLLHQIKESASKSGGLSAEIKSRLHDLRGEVLGMGRDLGKKLEQTSAGQGQDRSAEFAAQTTADIERVVNEGMGQLKQHVENIIRESSQQLVPTTDFQHENGEQMFAAVKQALTEHSAALVPAQQDGLDREGILEAVKEAYEEFKPEIELQQFGLERDEILQVLKEGLLDYQQTREVPPSSGASMEEVMSAIQSALQDFNPPRPVDEMALLREDLLASVSNVLQSFKPAEPAMDSEATRAAVMEAVKEGLAEHGPNAPREIEISRDDLFDAVKASLDGSEIPFHGFGEQVMKQLRDLVDDMKVEFKQYSAANGRDTEQVLDAVKDGLESLRVEVESYVDRAQDVTGKDEIVDVVRTGLENLRVDVQGYVAEGPTNGRNEMLDYIKAEFEHLHEAVSGQAHNEGDEARPSSTSEILAALESGFKGLEGQARLDEIAAVTPGAGVTSDLLEAIQGEFEQLRQSVSQSMVPGGSRADTEEVLDTVRLGLDDLRSHLDKKLDNPEHHMSLNNQLLDALNEGIEAMKTDVTKAMDQPTDATVNYEILETLKAGLADLKSEMEKITPRRPRTSDGAELVLAEDVEAGEARDIPPEGVASSSSPLRERMELLFAQLQIKVEGMAASLGDMPAPPEISVPEGITLKEDLVGLEDMLKEIQATVGDLAAKGHAQVENAVTKDDTDAIETLLRNTKAQIEELPLPDPATLVTKEHLDAVEAVVHSANEAIEGLATKIEEHAASKADLAVVEVLVKDLKEAFDGLRDGLPKAPEEAEELEEGQQSLTKSDLDVLGIICTEIKDKVGDLSLPDVKTLPTRSDVEQLTGLINDFRESHDKVKESYEADIFNTAKAFDDRKQEAEDIAAQIDAIKTFLEEVKEELLTKITDGEANATTIGETLKGMEDNVSSNAGVGADVKELLETVKNEFERAHGSLEGIKVDHEQNGATLLEKHGEHKDAIVAAVLEKVDICYDGLMSKYDDAQIAADEKVKMMEEKALEQQEILASTKEMTDELKLSIDTLGTSLTAFIPTFTEANEKMAEDHKTLFEKVDNTNLQFTEGHEAQKAGHQATRDEVAKALDGLTGLQADFTEYHPRFLMELKELLATVNQHYEHSKSLGEAADQHATSMRELFISGIPALLPAPTEPVEKYDDTGVHEKLDKLVDLAGEAGMATAQMARLDEIQEQVKATAAEVSAFVAMQNKAITEGNENKEREAEEVAILLERRQVQKDAIEADITGLNDEKSNLTAIVEALRAEKEALTSQKSKLNADVSSLQVALNIRKEELHDMDAKADALERRILEGLIDHSRAMLLTKQTPRTSPKKQVGRDLRNPSDGSAPKMNLTPVASPGKNHALAMRTRPLIKRNGATPNSGERRIMSLSQISKNVPSGAAAFSTPTPSLVSATGQLGRSHSVKNHKLRKHSWGPISFDDHDKENEIEEEGSEFGDQSSDVSHGACTVADSDLTHGTGSYTDGVTPTDDGRRTSYGTYDTGSYMTGSDLDHPDRRTSHGSTIRSTVGAQTIDEDDVEDQPDDEPHAEAEDEEDDGNISDMESEIQRLAEQAHREHLAEQEANGGLTVPGTHQHVEGKDVVAWAPPSDSGLGTDLPTGHVEGSEGSYFHPTGGVVGNKDD
ncbi:hypothetical protein BDV97DRAFT_374099 [Delphinella strobiligena]|nr:hypothetical protein BDV97DRAFT_374099 [Delphinella strobiligena]